MKRKRGLYLDDSTYELVKAEATREQRSSNNMLVVLIKEALDARKREEAS